MIEKKTVIKNYWGVALAAVIAFAFPLVVKSNYILNICVLAFIYASASSGWNIVGGYMGHCSFGHAAFIGLGGYTVFLTANNLNIPPLVGLVLAGIVGAIGSLIISYPCFRLKGTFYALATLAFAQILYVSAIHFKEFTGGNTGLTLPFKKKDVLWLAFSNKVGPYYVALIMLIITLIIVTYVDKSLFGMKLRAIRENDQAAESLGIFAPKEKLKAAAISGFITAMAGGYYAVYCYIIDPSVGFATSHTVNVIIYSAIGGMGTIFGPVIGALLVTPLNNLLNAYFGSMGYYGVNMLVLGVVLILIILFKPTGLLGIVSDIKAKRAKKALEAMNSEKDAE